MAVKYQTKTGSRVVLGAVKMMNSVLLGTVALALGWAHVGQPGDRMAVAAFVSPFLFTMTFMFTGALIAQPWVRRREVIGGVGVRRTEAGWRVRFQDMLPIKAGIVTTFIGSMVISALGVAIVLIGEHVPGYPALGLAIVLPFVLGAVAWAARGLQLRRYRRGLELDRANGFLLTRDRDTVERVEIGWVSSLAVEAFPADEQRARWDVYRIALRPGAEPRRSPWYTGAFASRPSAEEFAAWLAGELGISTESVAAPAAASVP